EPKHQGEGDEFNVERAIQMSLESFQAQSQAHVVGVTIQESVVEATQPPLLVKGKGGLQPWKSDQLDPLHNHKMMHQQILFMSLRLMWMLKQVLIQTRQPVEARSDPGKTPETRPPPKQEFMEEDQAGSDPEVSQVALVGPNHEPTYEEFMANVYPDVHGSLKLPVDEPIILEEALRSFENLLSIKNLDDVYTLGDQFLNDKSTKDDPGKFNIDLEVVSMVTVLIHQVSSSVPSLSTPIIDLSPLKPVPTVTPLKWVAVE
nr:hypothetical protein [Tanacetum cinerariifolium]